MDCLIKTVKSEGYFGMYRGETLNMSPMNIVLFYRSVFHLSPWIYHKTTVCFCVASRSCGKSHPGNPREGHQARCEWLLSAQVKQRRVSSGFEKHPRSLPQRPACVLIRFTCLCVLSAVSWQCSERCWQAAVQECARSSSPHPWRCWRSSCRMPAAWVITGRRAEPIETILV